MGTREQKPSLRGIPLTAPRGMRDQLPGDARRRAALGGQLLEVFERWGYERVATPPFEYADVLERGLEVDRRDVVRFVEPDTGEVALLRPDITPQIARIVATRLAHRPPPFRLCYRGSVVRRRRGRARKSGQRTQAGVECVGRDSRDADAEVVALAAEALTRVGLAEPTIELGQVRIGALAMQDVPEAARRPAMLAMAAKDVHALEGVLAKAGVPKRARRRPLTLLELWGDPERVLADAKRRLRDAASREALDELTEVYVRVLAGLAAVSTPALPGPRLGIDLGELRGHAYYTGVSFTVLAAGPGEPLGGGGRYDELVGRFGRPMPATGFALDVDHVAWALERQSRSIEPAPELRLVCTFEGDLGGGSPVIHLERTLREAGIVVARVERDALAFARAWGYAGVVRVGGDGLQLRRARDGKKRALECDAEGDYTSSVESLREWLLAEE